MEENNQYNQYSKENNGTDDHTKKVVIDFRTESINRNQSDKVIDCI